MPVMRMPPTGRCATISRRSCERCRRCLRTAPTFSNDSSVDAGGWWTHEGLAFEAHFARPVPQSTFRARRSGADVFDDDVRIRAAAPIFHLFELYRMEPRSAAVCGPLCRPV